MIFPPPYLMDELVCCGSWADPFFTFWPFHHPGVILVPQLLWFMWVFLSLLTADEWFSFYGLYTVFLYSLFQRVICYTYVVTLLPYEGGLWCHWLLFLVIFFTAITVFHQLILFSLASLFHDWLFAGHSNGALARNDFPSFLATKWLVFFP